MRGRALRARGGAQQDVPDAAQHGGARAALARLLAARRRAPPRAPARARAPRARLAAARPHRGTRPNYVHCYFLVLLKIIMRGYIKCPGKLYIGFSI